MARISLAFLSLLFLFSVPAWAKDKDEEKMPIVSANGFSCSQNDEMVTCRGSFPGNSSPIIEGTGMKVVWIRSEYPGQTFTYYSDSGCLCKSDFKTGGEVNQQTCTSHFGHEKAFKTGKSSFDWCKKN